MSSHSNSVCKWLFHRFLWMCIILPLWISIFVIAQKDFVFPGEIMESGEENNKPFYRYYDYNSESENEKQSVQNNKINGKNNNIIPIHIFRNLTSKGLNDFLSNHVDGLEDEGVILQGRFGGVVNERDSSVKLAQADCKPEMQTVKIATSTDPSVLYLPECVRIERCGGCCYHSLLTCRPQQIEIVNYQVQKLQYIGGEKFQFIENEIIPIEKHTKCNCDCIVTANDCNIAQNYSKAECSCNCKNKDEELKCHNNSEKLWNPESCACQCRNRGILPCATGYRFNNHRCQCVIKRNRQRVSNSDRRQQRKQ